MKGEDQARLCYARSDRETSVEEERNENYPDFTDTRMLSRP